MLDLIDTQKIYFQYPIEPGLVSIVICVYNSERYLKQMLDSIYAQTYNFFEVIVAYDTKSTDNSIEILKYYSDKYGLIIDRGNDSSLGFARARGARLARGEFFIHFDGDDLIVPTYLEDLLECFVRYPDLNVAYGGFCEVSEREAKEQYRCLNGAINTYSTMDVDKALYYYRNYRYLNRSHYFIMGSVWVWLVRREYLQNIGYFSPNITKREDNVYVAQLLLNTSKVGHTSNAGYLWIVHNTSCCHKMKTYKQHKDELERVYAYLNPLFISAGYSKLISQQEELDTLGLPSLVALSLRTLPYSQFKEGLKAEGITHLNVAGSIPSKLNALCFNVSKWLYWMMHHIKNKM